METIVQKEKTLLESTFESDKELSLQTKSWKMKQLLQQEKIFAQLMSEGQVFHTKSNKKSTCYFSSIIKNNSNFKIKKGSCLKKKASQNYADVPQLSKKPSQKIENNTLDSLKEIKKTVQSLQQKKQLSQVSNVLAKIETKLRIIAPISNQQIEQQTETILTLILKLSKKFSSSKLPQKLINSYVEIYQKVGKQKKVKYLYSLMAEKLWENNNYEGYIENEKKLLTQFNEISSLLRIGQAYQMLEYYQKSLIYYKQYCQKNNSIAARLKIANIYSKNRSTVKKSVSILNSLIFEDDLLKNFRVQEMETIEKSLLLLANIYKGSGQIVKSISICEEFIQKHFMSYNVAYYLSLLYEEEGRIEEAFKYHLSALRSCPSFTPSFVELVSLSKVHSQFRKETLDVIRKNIKASQRNISLYRVLINFLLESNDLLPKQSTITLQLVYFAEILEKQQDINFGFEVQLLYKWIKDIYEETRDTSNQYYFRCLLMLAEIKMLNNQKVKALEELKFVKEYFEDLQSSPQFLYQTNAPIIQIYLTVLSRISNFLWKEGKLLEAIPYLQTAIDSKKKFKINNFFNEEEQIGDLYKQLNQYSLAKKHYEKAISRLDSLVKKKNSRLNLLKRAFTLNQPSQRLIEPNQQNEQQLLRIFLKINFVEKRSCFESIMD